MPEPLYMPDFYSPATDPATMQREETLLRRAYVAIAELARDYGLFDANGDLEKNAADHGEPFRTPRQRQPVLITSEPRFPKKQLATCGLKFLDGKPSIVIAINMNAAEYNIDKIKILLIHELIHIQKASAPYKPGEHQHDFYALEESIFREAVARGIIDPSSFANPLWKQSPDYDHVDYVGLSQLPSGKAFQTRPVSPEELSRIQLERRARETILKSSYRQPPKYPAPPHPTK